MKKKNVTFCLNASAIEKLRSLAEEEQRSMSQSVEILINKATLLGKPVNAWHRTRQHYSDNTKFMRASDLRLCHLIAMVPKLFKNFIIFEHPDYPDIDYGVKPLWIGFKADPQPLWEEYLKTIKREPNQTFVDNVIVSDKELNKDEYFMVVKEEGHILMKSKHSPDYDFAPIFKEILNK